MEETNVYEDWFGCLYCERCNAEILCDECGDMPDFCPDCGLRLVYEV